MLIFKQNFHQHDLNQFGIYGGRIRDILNSFNYCLVFLPGDTAGTRLSWSGLWNLPVEQGKQALDVLQALSVMHKDYSRCRRF